MIVICPAALQVECQDQRWSLWAYQKQLHCLYTHGLLLGRVDETLCATYAPHL